MASVRPDPRASVGKPDPPKSTDQRSINKYVEAPCPARSRPTPKEPNMAPREEIKELNVPKASTIHPVHGGPKIDSLGLNLIKLFTRDNTVPFPDEPDQDHYRPIEAIEEMIKTIKEGGDSLEAWKKMDSYPMLTQEEMRQWVLENRK